MCYSVWPVFAEDQINPDNECERKVRAFIALNDYPSAKKHALHFLNAHPFHQGLTRALLKATAYNDSYEKWFFLFDEHKAFIPALNDDIVCWFDFCRAQLLSNMHEAAENVRLVTVLAGMFVKDPIFSHILQKGMKDSSIRVRRLSVSVATGYGGGSPETEAIMAASKDLSEKVRLEAYHFLAARKIKDSAEMLLSTACSSCVGRNERNVALMAFVNLMDGLSQQEAITGLAAPDVQQRLITCALLEKFPNIEMIPLLITALHDPLVEVVMSGIEALLRIPQAYLESHQAYLKQTLMHLVSVSSHHSVKAGASALLALYGCEEGKNLLIQGTQAKNLKERNAFAAVLTACGDIGADVALEALQDVKDPHHKAQFALTLFFRRVHAEQSLKILEEYAKTYGINSQNLEEDKGVFFTFSSFQKESIKIRSLKLIRLLIANRADSSKDRIKEVLSLMPEYESYADSVFSDSAPVGLKECLHEIFLQKESQLKFKAALASAIWCKDLTVTPYLENIYYTSGYHEKARILQAFIALGVSDAKAILLCREACREPQRLLRTLAMSALLNSN
ncbi:hypothetical protein CLAVI_000722 [Candidatus Clavichlamydia salmonicola]|uniref:HEAT repeat domain-containing protein n=1 Tax=Candidatus Clavichlamydia salmonicola TaxID=469812 RepID=UPI001891CF8A|nr:hypothetical protein [Candidatus Clavichlamydia salmonicola]MBF5051091.1 hypothetical protein [Candidatus Clavichlamydia salmonicola]